MSRTKEIGLRFGILTSAPIVIPFVALLAIPTVLLGFPLVMGIAVRPLIHHSVFPEIRSLLRCVAHRFR